MKTMIENYINGNITTARKQARRFSPSAIRRAMIEMLGFSFRKATLCADYLKTGEGWQESCDAT